MTRPGHFVALFVCVPLSFVAGACAGMAPDQTQRGLSVVVNQSEVEQRKIGMTEIATELRAEIDPAVFTIRASTGGMRLSAIQAELFDTTTGELRAEGQQDLERIAHRLAAGAGGAIDVIGYAQTPADQGVTAARARLVLSVLQSVGIPGSVLRVVEGDNAAPALSSRIDIVVTSNLR